jgi:predicted kinase
MRLLDYLRPPDGGTPDWDRLARDHVWFRSMETCPQDPVHHQEGVLGIHLRAVHKELLALPEFNAMPQDDKDVLELAVLLHDVAKPATTRIANDGRVSQPGHSAKGDIMARRILWEDGVPFSMRESVCALIRFHQQPFHLLSKPDAEKRLFRISVASRCDLLAVLAEADARGRICDDPGVSADAVALFREYAAEYGCLSAPFPFATDHSRFLYFLKDDRNPYYEAHDDTRGEAILLSGLPGSGKSRWIEANAPADYEVVGYDETRERLGIGPTEDQGTVMQETKEQAKRIMGAKQNPKSFVWNSTGISRQRRGPLIDLFAAYNYRVRIVYLETSRDRHFPQNRDREKPVPAEAMEGQFRQWELPDLTEAQRVDYVVNEAPKMKAEHASLLHP